MYATFFGLRKDPFRTTPDPSILYLTAKHREALAGLSYCILMHKGFSVLTGDAGTGKTTLLSRVVQTVPRTQVAFSAILNSALTKSEFLESVMVDFGMEDIPPSKAQRLQLLQRFLMSEYTAGRTCVLLIDEAQKLSEEVLEEVRLLSNCELPDQKLLQIVLSGQSELEQVLESQGLRQLKQRIAVRLRIDPLTHAEVGQYIRFRWGKAGATEPAPFEAAAVTAIAEHSGGIPRLVNIICDNSLVLAFCENSRVVSTAHVTETAKDLVLTAAGHDAKQPDGTEPVLNGAARAGALTPRPEDANGTRGNGSVEPLPTLRRYGASAPQKSRMSRWAAKLPWARHADGVV